MKSKTKALQIHTTTMPGTTIKNKTGSWRIYKPEFNQELCSKCDMCAQYCPDSIVYKSEIGYYPDYEYCKGCGICANICPKNAIKMISSHALSERNVAVEKLENGFLTNEIKLAIVQLESPFYSQIIADENKCTFFWSKEGLNMLRSKIVSILNKIVEISQNKKPNIIVFPEYSIPDSMIDYLKKFADDNSIIIVAGSSPINDVKSKFFRKNICTVLIPHKEKYLIEKKVLSCIEAGYIEPGERNELDLSWEYNDKVYSIQINLSLDYTTPQTDNSRKDIIIIPMCSENVEFFTNKVNQDIKKDISKFIILCNAVTLIQKQRTPLIRGRTSLYGKVGISSETESMNTRQHEDFTLSNMGWEEGVLLTELNIENSSVSYINKFKLEYKEDAQLKLESEIRGIINPLLFEKLNRKLNFTFIITDNYWNARTLLKKPEYVNYTIYAISGSIDLIIQHYEDPYLSKMLKENSPKFWKETPYFTVNKIVRWFMRNNLEPPLGEPTKTELEDITKLELDWMASVPREKRKEYVNKRYILGHWKFIDISRANTIHAFIAINLSKIQNDKAPFEEILKSLINKYPYIFNVYEGEGKINDMELNYLIEIIDDPYWVFTLVNSIHQKCSQEEIKCRTMTSIVKENLSRGIGYTPLPSTN